MRLSGIAVPKRLSPDIVLRAGHLQLALMNQVQTPRTSNAVRRYLGRRAQQVANRPSPDDTPPPSPPRFDSVQSMSPKEVGDLLSRISARSAWRRAATHGMAPYYYVPLHQPALLTYI